MTKAEAGGEVRLETLEITKENLSQYANTEITFKGHIELSAQLGWVVFKSLHATGYIFAEAGTGIKAGGGIEAGTGIKAGGMISVALRIFAGLILWRKPTPEEMEIRCKRLESGEVAYGKLIEDEPTQKQESR